MTNNTKQRVAANINAFVDNNRKDIMTVIDGMLNNTIPKEELAEMFTKLSTGVHGFMTESMPDIPVDEQNAVAQELYDEVIAKAEADKDNQ